MYQAPHKLEAPHTKCNKCIRRIYKNVLRFSLLYGKVIKTKLYRFEKTYNQVLFIKEWRLTNRIHMTYDSLG